MSEGIETNNPPAVVISASEIAPAKRAGFPIVPPAPNTPKALIFPVTVPSKPSKVQIFAIVPKEVM